MRWSITEAAIGKCRGETDHAKESFTLDFKQTVLWKLEKQNKKALLVKNLILESLKMITITTIIIINFITIPASGLG